MQSHRFALGEFVAFTEKRFPGLIWAAEWEIIDLLEPADGTPRYRIRGPDGVSKEVISETELEFASQIDGNIRPRRVASRTPASAAWARLLRDDPIEPAVA